MKYPNQYEAQLLLDILNRPKLSKAGLSKEFQEVVDDADNTPENWVELWDRCFGENSPWVCEFRNTKRGNRMLVLKWSDRKFKKLNEKVDNSNS